MGQQCAHDLGMLLQEICICVVNNVYEVAHNRGASGRDRKPQVDDYVGGHAIKSFTYSLERANLILNLATFGVHKTLTTHLHRLLSSKDVVGRNAFSSARQATEESCSQLTPKTFCKQ